MEMTLTIAREALRAQAAPRVQAALPQAAVGMMMTMGPPQAALPVETTMGTEVEVPAALPAETIMAEVARGAAPEGAADRRPVQVLAAAATGAVETPEAVAAQVADMEEAAVVGTIK